MNRVSLRKGLLAASLSVSPFLIAPASAQGTAPTSEADNGGLADIIVTAQRQSQGVLSVPLSIDARSGDQLNATGIKNLNDLQFTSPGFISASGFGFAQLYVRGVGNSIFIGADPGVTTFVDDVPRIFGSLIAAFIDVDRVEVLKGAQGGLYGRNATGGVVNIITHQPSTDDIHASGLISYGSKKTFRAAAYFNLPLNEKIALSVSGERDSHGGYVKNIATANPYSAANFPTGAFLPTGPGGSYMFNTPAQTAAVFNAPVNPRKLDDLDLWSVNAKLLLRVTDSFKITLAGDYAKKFDNQGLQTVNLNPALAQNFLTGLFTAFGIDAQLPAGFVKGSAGKFTTAKSAGSLLRRKDYGGSATAIWNLPTVDLTSITAYREHFPDEVDEVAAVNVPLIPFRSNHKARFFYQELRAVSTGDGPLHLLGGATYLRKRYEANAVTDVLPPLIPGALTRSVLHMTNYTVYAQAGYDFTPELSLTASGRYIHEVNRSNFTDPVVSGTRAVEKKFVPSATLSYKLDGGGNIYARWARGFKGGGINPVVPPRTFPGSTNGSTFKGEQVDTFEAGYRSTLFDRRVQLTAAAFYNDYKNLQVTTNGRPQFPAIIYAIVNAKAARTYGAEGSLTWKVADPITVGINAGYLNAKYTDFVSLGDPILVDFNRSGRRMIFSPKTQISLTGSLDQPITDRFRLVGNLLLAHTSRTLFAESGIPGVIPNAAQPGYWLTNLRLGLRTADDRYGLAIFASNLFNKAYYTAGGSSGTYGTADIWGDPRIIGAELTAKF